MVAVTVSGSFHRHIAPIYDAVQAFIDAGLQVLSPADPRVVAEIGDFLIIASDRIQSARLIQQRHFESIRESSFLWLVAPDGYVGQSAAMEIGFAVSCRVPIFCTTPILDTTLREFITTVAGVRQGLSLAANLKRREHCVANVLVEPKCSIESAHRSLDQIARLLDGSQEAIPDQSFEANRAHIAATLGLS